MTRRLLVLAALTLALLFSGVVADSPTPAAGSAMVPATPASDPIAAPTFDVYLGGGILQVRIRGCDDCRTELSIWIELPPFAADLIAR